MFDKIFEFLSSFFDYLKFYWVIEQYNKGVLLRFGKFRKVMEPGFHWKLPFADIVVETTVVPTTMRLHHQSLHTRDEKNVVVQAIIKYQVLDVETLVLKVYDALDAIGDMTQAIIKNIIMERTWEECKDPEMDNTITKKARVEAKKWGIEIIQVTLVDINKSPSVRLITTPISQQDIT
jgi:regulator of protease activity HflC (stomatin/prohibitin superfamily)